MQHDPRAYLWDARESALAIQSFVADLDINSYSLNLMAQAATERKFEIIGEALNQLSKVDPLLAAKIPELAQIVSFRNQLIHGYSKIKPSTVWSVVSSSLPSVFVNKYRRNSNSIEVRATLIIETDCESTKKFYLGIGQSSHLAYLLNRAHHIRQDLLLTRCWHRKKTICI